MERYKKKQLILEESDSDTLQGLKKECNQLIEAYNLLDTPFHEQGVDLTRQISLLLDKIVVLRQL